MKHRLFIIPALFALTACGGGETPSAPTASTPSKATPAPAATSTQTAAVDPIARGATLFKRCRACHTLAEGDKNRVGPNLWAVYGATAGAKDGYAYSKAMKASEIVWTKETMDAYLTRPAAYMPGTKMSFAGLRKQEDRDALQAYLMQETGAK